MELKELKEITTKFQYVSFDVFDTLMFRTVSCPEAIFKLVEYKYKKQYGHEIRNFKKNRITAEQNARKNNNQREITLKQIYDLLDYDEDTKKKLILIEKSVEVQNCVPNIPMIDFLNWCRTKSKYIVIITDMYLDRATINAILNKVGVVYDKLFISGEVGKTKLEGTLYPFVLQELKINFDELLHIGDNPLSDLQRANENGIKAVERIENPFDTKVIIKDDIIEEHLSCFRERCKQSFSSYKTERILGIDIVAPIIVEFCKWVHENKEKQNLEKLLFVAREGFLIYKCYKILYPHDKSEYINLNRNLVRLPMIKQGKASEQLLASINSQPEYFWKDILQYLGVDSLEDVVDKIAKIHPGFRQEQIITYKDIAQGNTNDILDFLVMLLEESIENQRKMLRAYLTQIGITSHKVGLVNNSINGTGQYLIERFLCECKERCDILGLQFIASDKCINRLGDRSLAWLSSNEKHKKYVHLFKEHALLFEHLLFEPTGTAEKLYYNSDGTVRVFCDSQRMELYNNDIIFAVQDAVIRFTEWMSTNIDITIGINSFKNFISMIEYPEYKIAELICNLYDDDIENDRKLADPTIPYYSKYLLMKDIPHTIKWIQGYLVLNSKGRIALTIYNCRREFRELRNALRDLKWKKK